MTSKFWI
nr:unnamed protein product [Callosobruchus analis]